MRPAGGWSEVVDPQSGTLPNSGAAVCEFGLAVNRTWKDADGNAREEVLFIDCTAFGRQAETLGKYLGKGRPIHVEGRLKLDRWEQDGQQRSKVRVVVEPFRFVDLTSTATATKTLKPPATTGPAPRQPHDHPEEGVGSRRTCPARAAEMR